MIHLRRTTVTLADLRTQGILEGYRAGYPHVWGELGFEAVYHTVRGRWCSQCRVGHLRPYFYHRWSGDLVEALVLGVCDSCLGAERIGE